VIQKRGIAVINTSNLSGGEKTLRYASAKRRLKSNHFSNKLPDQNEDILYNPINHVNPDSKPQLQAPPKTKTTYC
jgi:hypothetical protein